MFVLLGKYQKLFPVFSLLLLFSLIPVCQAVTITVDGDGSDWAGVSPILTDPTGDESSEIDIITCSITDDGSMVYFKMDLVDGPNTELNTYHIYIDTDRNSETGYSINDIGADYRLVHDRFLLRRLYSWIGSWSYDKQIQCQINTETHILEWGISYADLGISAGQSIDVVFYAAPQAGSDYAPDEGHVTYPKTPSETKPVGGIVFQIDKLAILSPYLMIAFAVITATSILIKKRRY